MAGHGEPAATIMRTRAGIAPVSMALGLFLLILSSLCTVTAAFAAPQRIADPRALSEALQTAEPGDVLLLAPGNYGLLHLSRDFGPAGLTLRASDPAHPPRFTRFEILGAGGVTLEDLVFSWKASSGSLEKERVSRIEKSRDITLRRLLLEGGLALDGRPEVRGHGMGYGLWVRNATGVRIEDSEFRIWSRAMIFSQSEGITLRGNRIHAIRSDGVDFAAVSHVLVEKNHFHDFDRAPKSTDHPDMIQFWTNQTKTPSVDITIRDNLFNSGHGLYTQTIFMRNEEVDTGRAGREMFYRDVTITGNIIINAQLHGISLGEAEGVRIASNTLIRNRASQGTGKSDQVWIPSIRVSPKADRVEISHNIVSRIIGPEKRPDWKVADNLLIQDRAPDEPGYYGAVFSAAMHGDPSSLASFAYREGGPADGRTLGAPGLRRDQIAARLTRPGQAILEVDRDPVRINRFHFGADQLSDGSAGLPDWDFGDGTRKSGARVSHDFARPGEYRVALHIGGASDPAATARIIVPDPRILHLSPGQGLLAGGQKIAGAPVLTGGQEAAIEIAQSLLGPLPGTPDFALNLTFTTRETDKAAGEILRLHGAMVLDALPSGQLQLRVFSGEKGRKPTVLRSRPGLRVNDGKPHNVTVRLAKGTVELQLDGRLMQVGRGVPILPRVNRPLILGGGYGNPGLPVLITAFDLSAGAGAFEN